MNVNDIIVLENNKSYLLLLDTVIKADKYYLAVELDNNENPTNNYVVVKEEKEGNDIYMEITEDPYIYSELIKMHSERG